MPDTITSQPSSLHGTVVSATAASNRARADDETAHLYEQLQSLAARPIGCNELLHAIFSLQLGRTQVVACAAVGRRSDGSFEVGLTRSRLPEATLEPLVPWLVGSCQQSLADQKGRVTYTQCEGWGAICVPVQAGSVAGLVTLVQHSDDGHRRATEMAVAQLGAAFVNRWHDQQRSAAISDQLANSAAIVELVQRIESAVDSKSACFAVAAALKHHLRCEKVVVGLTRRGHSCRVIAVSGAAEVDERAEPCRRMKAALDECLVRDAFGAWPPLPAAGSGESSRAARPASGPHQLLAHKQLARRDSCVLSSPLKTLAGESVGSLLIVAPRELAAVPQVARFVDALGEPLGSALSLVRRAEGSWLRRVAGAVLARQHNKKRWVAAALSLAVLGMMLIPLPYKIACRSVTEPVVRRLSVAPHDGLLQTTLAEPGDMVADGQLLARMDGREVRWELAGIIADIERASKRRDLHMAQHETTDALLAELEMKRLESRSRLLQFREQKLKIVSPIEGIVLSGSLERRENSPVTKGQLLYEIAPLESLRVEIGVPADEVTRVQPGMTVSMTFDGLGGEVFSGQLSKLRPRSEIRDDDNVFVGTVLLDNTDRQLRPGMKGRAKIISRRRAIGWILFHRAWENVCVMWPW